MPVVIANGIIFVALKLIMRISKEVRVGVLLTISLTVLLTGFYFLKGADLFSNNRSYICYYNSVDGLINSSNVQLRGFNVGRVSYIELDGNKRIKVTMQIKKNIAIPKGSVATLLSDGLLGTKVIRLDLAEGTDLLTANGELKGVEELGLIDNLGSEVSPIMASLRKTIETLDTVITGVNLITNAENRQAITATIKSINATSDNLAKLSASLAGENENIKSIISNTNSITGSFAKSNDTIKQILSHLNNVSGQLANSQIQKTFGDLQGSVTQLQGILNKVNNNEGSLGLLVNDKNLYNNMNSSLKSLDKLMTDLKEHPSRYINVTVFGKKKKQ